MSAANTYLLKVAEVIAETADAHSVVFDVGQYADRFAYRPGQFLTLSIPYADKPLLRCYSLSSTPAVDTQLKVTIKRVADGRGSNWICDNLKAGDSLEVMRPAGVFTPKSLDGDFWLFAGGSGITPVFSILKAVLTQGSGTIKLFYANRDEQSVIFAQELKQWVAQYPERLQILHWLDSLQGYLNLSQLGAWLSPQTPTPECFICGPEPFMACAENALAAAGIAKKHVHVERFVSLDDAEPAPVINHEAGEAVAIEVHLDGQLYQVQGSTQEPILTSLLNAGLDAPFSCRTGGCAACMCHLQEGEASMLKNEVLDEDDIAAGWVLSCQALPVSDKVKVSFSG